ncbi:hypothetical protein ASG40_10255 [Methylobacterium sp. Leaf399]|nr:hypothetical protein ASG40_10255 [Methylobacterium sp. Leaf399]
MDRSVHAGIGATVVQICRNPVRTELGVTRAQALLIILFFNNKLFEGAIGMCAHACTNMHDDQLDSRAVFNGIFYGCLSPQDVLIESDKVLADQLPHALAKRVGLCLRKL